LTDKVDQFDVRDGLELLHSFNAGDVETVLSFTMKKNIDRTGKEGRTEEAADFGLWKQLLITFLPSIVT